MHDKIYGISRWLLDPRRPANPTSEDKEEGLVPYKPILDFDPKDVMSYSRGVLGCTHFASAATDLESTSVVLAYGLDMFCTKRAPSREFDLLSEDFGHASLVLTLCALFVGIQITKRMVSFTLIIRLIARPIRSGLQKDGNKILYHAAII
jgi:hypothetical protein